MTITLDAATERALSEQARAHGRPLHEYAADLITWTVQPAGDRPRPAQGTPEWLAEFHAWVDSHEHVGHPVDDSRDSIYGGLDGRGE